jgi:hypothetical protein
LLLYFHFIFLGGFGLEIESGHVYASVLHAWEERSESERSHY